jgi:hypothetical protein
MIGGSGQTRVDLPRSERSLLRRCEFHVCIAGGRLLVATTQPIRSKPIRLCFTRRVFQNKQSCSEGEVRTDGQLNGAMAMPFVSTLAMFLSE